MNTRPRPAADPRPDAASDRFEQALREQHALAVECLSPRLRAQLAQRRNAALRGIAPTHAGWNLRPLAAGVAMAAVLALGLHLVPPDGNGAQVASGIANTAVQPAPNTILDEDPEFYAWLASADAQLMAME